MASSQIDYVTRACKNCGNDFSFPMVGRGMARLHCTPKCAADYGRQAFANAERGTCTAPGCADRVDRPTVALCEKHYIRLRRTGTFQRKPRAKRKPTSAGYMLCGVKGHALATPGGTLYEHRAVLYDAIGPGTHACFWCGTEIEWMVRGDRKLVVDHLNGCKADNRLENLVASCHKCNFRRGAFESWVRDHQQAPFLLELFDRQRAQTLMDGLA